MKTPEHIPRILTLCSLSAVLVLAGIAGYRRRPPEKGSASQPRFSMRMLDEKAQPFIDEANAALPATVDLLCSRPIHLYTLLLKDKYCGGTAAREYIKSIIEPRIVEPLRKAAAVYGCAANAESAVGLTEETALDNLSRQLYATMGLAIEGVFIKATINSCIRVVSAVAPKLASAWGMAGTCAAADGPLLIGDCVGVALAVGGTVWCCNDIQKAFRALPSELSGALRTAIEGTVIQCRQEAASALLSNESSRACLHCFSP